MGPIITKILIRSRQEGQSRRYNHEAVVIVIQGMQVGSGDWKGQGTDFPLESPERTQPPVDTLILAL